MNYCVEHGKQMLNLFGANHVTGRDIWYVSYRSNITPKRENGEHIVRATRKFKDEAEARQFAQEVIERAGARLPGP